MDVYSGSARQTLRLPAAAGEPQPALWAVFDPAWYQARHPDAPDGTGEQMLEWYLSRGQTLGHSPNRWFDEAWQRRAWTGIQELIDAGTVPSAFDAWCRNAHFTWPPHWLFSPEEYERGYPALTQDILLEAGLLNHYDHYLRFGAREHRIGHAMFDPAVYLAALEPEEREAAGLNPILHYLSGLEDGAPERRTSVLFDPAWYRERYPAAAVAVEAGRYRSLLEHYLGNETPAAFDPSPSFSESWYLENNPGVAAAIGPGAFRNGFAHFIAHGMAEGRSPHPDLDLLWYAALPQVRADIEAGRAGGAYAHWREIGDPGGRAGRSLQSIAVSPAQGAALSARKAAAIATVLGRWKLGFAYEGTPALSVVMPVGTDGTGLLTSLASLSGRYADTIDLILIQSGEFPPGAAVEAYVDGATILRFDGELTGAAAREAGVVAAVADTILFLGDGMELAPGAVDAALYRLASDPRIGATGARIVQPHGVLAEAGGIVWRDGTLHPYMGGHSPLAAEAGFVRDADFCSLSCLFARKDVLAALPPPGVDIAGTSHEAADLCARIQEAGFRVVYDPAVLAFQTSPPPRRLPNGQAAFARDHPDFLFARPDAAPEAVPRARSPDRGQTRVLVVEDSIPLRRIGSGFVRSNDIVRAMADAGVDVTIFPIAASPFPLSAILADFPDTVEIMHGLTLADFDDFMAAREGFYDTIWVARTHNLDKLQSALATIAAREARPPRIVVDTEAVAALRQAGQAALQARAFDLEAALAQEFRSLTPEMDAIAVTEAEAAILRPRHLGPIGVIGHAIAPAPTPAPFQERAGMLFAAAFHGLDHPNHDGLVWFVEEVLPLIEQSLRWETRLTVAGYLAPGMTLDRFAGHPRVTLCGPVDDLRPLYDSHRIVVAPTRFAAGIPYKVHEAAAMGVPAVVTSLLAQQLGWLDGEALSVAKATDAAGFAERIVALYRNQELWERQREAALVRVAADLDPDRFAAQVARLALRHRPLRRSDSGLSAAVAALRISAPFALGPSNL